MTVNRMGIRGIDHIGITVSNLDEAIEFFIQIFGAKVLVRHPPYMPNPEINVNNFARHPETAVNGIALIEIAGSLLELLEYDAPDKREEFPRTSDSGGHHVAFYVEDMNEALDQLRNAGVEILGDPLPFAGDEAGPRARFVYTRAPWGLFIELVTYPEGKTYQHR